MARKKKEPEIILKPGEDFQRIYVDNIVASKLPDDFRLIIANLKLAEFRPKEGTFVGNASFDSKIVAEIIMSHEKAENLYDAIGMQLGKKEKKK